MSELWAVTGASGYVGRALCDELRRSDIAVRGLSRSGGADSIAADIREPAALRKLVLGADVVIHLAAYVHRPARGVEAEEECRSVNVNGTRALMDALASVNPGAFAIVVSSASVYGPSETSLDETGRCHPRTIYGRSKLEAETLFLAAVVAGAARGCVVRPAMIFGPRAPGNLPRLVRMVKTGFAIEVAGGSQRKSLLPISDLIAAIRAIVVHRDACNGQVFNVSGEALTMHEIVIAIAAARRKAIRFVPLPRGPMSAAAGIADFLLQRFGSHAPSISSFVETYTTSSVLDDSKLRRMTGYAPPRAVRDALVDLATAS